MAFEQRDNSGVLFKNDKKGNEKAPDYTGSGMVDGFEYKFAAWIKEGKKGKFMSVNFQRKDEVAESKKPQTTATTTSSLDSFESDIPFN
ncbi:MAG: hypothetical protein PHE88_11805 [Elusimicrobia bacterium]|nr:hypothetical protein [Elusimicrobiota bacterium]